MESIPYVAGQEDSRVLWEWLEASNTTPYITFVQDAHYSLNLPGAGEAVKERLQQTKDIDLMLVMGTAAGRLLADDTHETPVMVFSTSNAVEAGIIDRVEDSGQNHIWAHMDAQRYQRQINVFHDIFQFQRLGIVYEDSPEGRIYAALEDVNRLSKILNFQVVTRTVSESAGEADRERYHQELLQAYEELAAETDAFYLTAGTRDIQQLQGLLTPFHQAGIPVFSQMGGGEVQRGALLSLYRADFSGVGLFGAHQVGQVLNGATPRSLSQVYGDTPSIVLNIAAAEATGYQPPFEILLIADEIYHTMD